MIYSYEKFNSAEDINPGDIISLLPVAKKVIKSNHKYKEEQIIRGLRKN